MASSVEGFEGSVLAASPDGILVVDAGERIIFVSDQVARLFGYAVAEIVNQPIDMLLPERLRASHAESRRNYLATPTVRRMGAGRKLLGRRKDGSEFPVDVGLSPVFIANRPHVICSVRDVTERWIAEEALDETARRWEAQSRENSELLRLFVLHSPASVAMLDRELRYIAVSRRWLEDFGLEGRELAGQRHYDVFPEIPERWREIHRRGLAGEASSSSEDSFTRLDGTVEWLRWEVQPWKMASGDVGGLIFFAEVITKRVLAERALRESHEVLEDRVALRTRELDRAHKEAVRADVLKSRFLSAASHDLRQPLQAASIYLSALERQTLDPLQRDICDRVRQSLEAMTDIINALLDISRLESGHIKPQVRDFDIGQMIDRVVIDNRPQAEEKGLELLVESCHEFARSDPALLERILDNFVSNAIRYTETGRIEIRCECQAGMMRLSVSDTGAGIPLDKQETIFDEYVQLGNRARDWRKGLGLGLSIVRHIARILGHEVELRSEPGRGSVFTVSVPVGTGVGARPASADARVPRTASDRHGVVLIVDDDDAVRQSLRLLLKIEGFEAHAAESAATAQALIEGGLRPDVVISDYRLPKGDGVSLLGALRARLGGLPAVLMTGDLQVRSLADDPQTTVIHKPVDSDLLLGLLRTLCRSRAATPRRAETSGPEALETGGE